MKPILIKSKALSKHNPDKIFDVVWNILDITYYNGLRLGTGLECTEVGFKSGSTLYLNIRKTKLDEKLEKAFGTFEVLFGDSK